MWQPLQVYTLTCIVQSVTFNAINMGFTVIEWSGSSIESFINIFGQISGWLQSYGSNASYACPLLNMSFASILTNTSLKKCILGKFMDYRHNKQNKLKFYIASV